MSWQYSFEFYPYASFKEKPGEQKRIFACREKGRCVVEKTYPEYAELIELFKTRDKKGFELTQIFFQDQGILALYRKPVDEEIRRA